MNKYIVLLEANGKKQKVPVYANSCEEAMDHIEQWKQHHNQGVETNIIKVTRTITPIDEKELWRP